VQAIDDTKHKIWSDMTRRRTILEALAFVVRTDFLIWMNKGQRDLSMVMASDPSAAPSLLQDLLRKAPSHLSMPIVALEDVVTLFDA